MGFFGFIENFFFISLALVFVLVLLLVYHFKNRIAVAEKKSESMYGLLTAVVKEIKSLRGMFGLGSQPEPENSKNEDISVEVRPKSTPEVNITAGIVHPPVNVTYDSFVNSRPKEVISLDFSASEENKIVVSDNDSEDDEDTVSSEEESENDESSISSDESEPSDSVDVLDISEVIRVSDHLDPSIKEEQNNENIVDIVDVSLNEPSVTEENKPPLPSIDQLKKMNINQLKTVASQVGVTSDVSKMKKPELINVIQAALQ